MRKQKTTVTNKNYTGIKNSTPRELIENMKSSKFQQKFFELIKSYFQEKGGKIPLDEMDNYIRLSIGCLGKVLKGEAISNTEACALDFFLDLGYIKKALKQLVSDEEYNFIAGHLFWGLYTNSRMLGILEEIEKGAEDLEIKCISLFGKYGLYEIFENGAIDYVILDSNMRMVKSRDILSDKGVFLLGQGKELPGEDDINIVIENGNNEVEVWNGSITEGFTRTVNIKGVISGKFFHQDVIEILHTGGNVELYEMSNGECIFSQSSQEVQKIVKVVGRKQSRVVHFLGLYEGKSDIHKITIPKELDDAIFKSSLEPHIIPHPNGAVLVCYNSFKEEYVLFDTHTRELIAGIMTFTNKEGEVFYGGEVPFFIMDTDDVWLSYSIRNPDDTETKGHFSSIKNSDMRPETNIHSSSPTKYVH